MLVFQKENLVFLSVPKTGTTAYMTALRDRADIVVANPPLLKHAPVYRYNRFFRPMFVQVCNSEPDLLAVVREPVSWLGSWYRYRQRPFMEGKPNSTHNVSFDEFVQGYLMGQRPGYANVGSQARFLEAQPNGCKVSYLFRYDDQAGLTAFLEERLSTKIDTQRQNVSPQMQLDLSEKTLKRLKRKHSVEFELYESIAVQ